MPTQHVNLTERNALFVQKQVEAGLFKNVSEVHRAALVALEQQEEVRLAKLERLKAEAKIGFDAIDAGEYRDFSDTAELNEYMDSVLNEVLGEDDSDAEPLQK